MCPSYSIDRTGLVCWKFLKCLDEISNEDLRSPWNIWNKIISLIYDDAYAVNK